MNRLVVVIGLFVIIVIGAVVLIVLPAPAKAPGGATPASLPDLITVSAPLPNTTIASPLTISGQARGGWYFEASAPVVLKNSVGTVIAEGHVNAQGDWMTADFVPFSTTLTFPPQPAGSAGTLVLMNDNLSGLPENQNELSIAITF